MEVRFNPDRGDGGVCAFASWNNPDLHRAFCVAFNLRANEKLVRIDVTKEGIRAYFEQKNIEP